jgi:hypothetical protein
MILTDKVGKRTFNLGAEVILSFVLNFLERFARRRSRCEMKPMRK